MTVFISKYLGLKKVVRPARYIYDNFGQRQYQGGKSVQFSDGRLETDDQEVVDFLMDQPRYGIDFWALDENGNVIPANAEKMAQEAQKEQQALDTTTNSCPKCSFKAKNRAGIMAHMRSKHSGNQNGQEPENTDNLEPEYTQGS